MPLATETVNIDITLPDGTEFDSVTFVAQLSDATWDTVDNQAVPRAPVSVELDSNGVGTIELWPNDRGIKQTYYTAVVQGILSDTNAKRDYQIGKFFPSDGDGPFDLNALLSIGFDETIITPTLVQRAETAAEEAEASATAASTSASNASTSASNASTSASNATASASSAETYADQAELAAISAGAPLFDSTADGLAGTSDGDIFLIRTAQGLQTYRNDTGSATFLGWLGPVVFNTVANVIADDADTYGGDGTLVEAGGFRYLEDSTASVGFIKNSATVPVKLRYIRDDEGYNHAAAFGCVLDGVTDDTDALKAATDAAVASTGLLSITGNCRFDPSFLTTYSLQTFALYIYFQELTPTDTIIVSDRIFFEGRNGDRGHQFSFPPHGLVNHVSGKPTFWFKGARERGLKHVHVTTSDDIPVKIRSDDGEICANVILENISLFTAGTDKSGLQIDNAFWVWVKDSAILAQVQAPQLARSSIEIIATNTTSYCGLIYLYNVRTSSGGIYVGGRGSTRNIAGVSLKDYVQENGNQPLVTIDSDNMGLCLNFNFENANIADNRTASYLIDVLGDPSSVYNFSWKGQAAIPIINKRIKNFQIQSYRSPSYQSGRVDLGNKGPGTSTLHDGVFSGEWDGQGGLYGPVAAPTTILDVNQDVSAWSGLSGTATVTTGVLAPDGTLTAANIDDGSKTVLDGLYSVSAGDWIVYGMWSKALGEYEAPNVLFNVNNATWVEYGSGENLPLAREIRQRKDFGWYFTVMVGQLATVASGTERLTLNLRSDAGLSGAISYWKPFAMKFSSGVDEREVYRIARHSVNIVEGSVPGVASQFPHQTLRTGTGITGDRPSGTLPAGSQWFDTTLAQPIWADGSGGWVDATGTSV